MAQKRVLLLDGPFLTAHHWSNGRIKTEGQFSHEPAGLAAFAEYLTKYRSSLYYVLADVSEEGFQLEDLPYVQGADRTALLQRRLNQYYYNTQLSTAISLGRAKDGRRDEKLLFAALTRAETFAPWLEALLQAEALLAGVYSVPLVLANCALKLMGADGPVLVITLTRGGVRQTFFDHGELRFSRLSPLATRNPDEIGRTCAADAAKIFQYLVAQRQIPRGASLRTLVLAHPDQTADLQRFCDDSNELSFEFVDLVASARRLGLKDIADDSHADSLLIHCLAANAPSHQFAPAKERRFFRLWQIRHGLTRAAWIVLAGCLLFAGRTAIHLYELGNSTEATRALTATDSQRYQRILDGLPKISVTTDTLRAVMTRFDTLQKHSPAIEPLLIHLSLALNENPKIDVVRLVWKAADQNSGDKSAGGGGNIVEVLEVIAQLPLGMAVDKRAQIEMIEGFATRLRNPQTDVRIVSRPFDIESDKPLKSTGEAGDPQTAEVPRFTLRIARQL